MVTEPIEEEIMAGANSVPTFEENPNIGRAIAAGSGPARMGSHVITVQNGQETALPRLVPGDSRPPNEVFTDVA